MHAFEKEPTMSELTSDNPSVTTESTTSKNSIEWVTRSFAVGPLQCNCTIVGDTNSGEAIVVDPGGDVDLILMNLSEMGLSKVTRILHTHAHFDHFMASGQLKEKTEAELALHRADEYLWTHLEDQCARYNLRYVPVPPPDHWLKHEEELSLNGCTCGKVIHTPGHTPGSASFWFEDNKLLLAGDTLFRGSIGRTDLWGGDYETIEKSIKERLYSLDDEATVITGHGPETTLGREMRTNQFVRA
jgi:hydroxyacylglutathione hydrolase